MNQKSLVANWKLFKTFDESIDFLQKHHALLNALTEKHGVSLTIAPNLLALAESAKMLISSSIRLAAQDVSAHGSGPYTGQIDARSFKSLGVAYCLIGHSELREAYQLSNDTIAAKMISAIANNLIPILCIGETGPEHEANQTNHVLMRQLAPIFTALRTLKYTNTWYIAYEPIWAINSEKPIAPSNLAHVLDHIISHWPDNVPMAQFFYGGSVNPVSIKEFAQESRLSGFLVGKASTDIEMLSTLIQEM